MDLFKNNIDKIELASQDEVSQLEPYIDKVLEALGHPEALVTDESYVSDFLCIVDEKETDLELKKACKKLNLSFKKADSIVDVARRVKENVL